MPFEELHKARLGTLEALNGASAVRDAVRDDVIEAGGGCDGARRLNVVDRAVRVRPASSVDVERNPELVAEWLDADRKVRIALSHATAATDRLAHAVTKDRGVGKVVYEPPGGGAYLFFKRPDGELDTLAVPEETEIVK